MGSHDILSDMFSRIKNALNKKITAVVVLNSNLSQRVLDVLCTEGYLRGYQVKSFREIEVYLKYSGEDPVIRKLERVSRPGKRVYASAKDLLPVQSGVGIYVLSTSKGVISDSVARKLESGGEILCKVW
uniref:Ribosomal protein S8 n=1 Tax=Jakoba bahamiensis TaxID=221721 RepID=M4Q9W7_9EUKA|nr:ribosomal protein S8 [Jakoba bahamiensis]AGH24161.1 ribosomal protein S8 [Jakoba bahamiensis]